MNYEFADRLIEMRRKQNMSQEELAAALGLSRQAISKWERAESSPDIVNLVALSKLYGISLDELVSGTVSESTISETAPEDKMAASDEVAVLDAEADAQLTNDSACESAPADPHAAPQAASPASQHAAPHADPQAASPASQHAAPHASQPAAPHADPQAAPPVGSQPAPHADPHASQPAAPHAALHASQPAAPHADPQAASPASQHAAPHAAPHASQPAAPHADPQVDPPAGSQPAPSADPQVDPPAGSQPAPHAAPQASRVADPHASRQTSSLQSFPYPILCVILYLIAGFFFGAWHPAWIIFLTIPFYYWIVNIIKHDPDYVAAHSGNLDAQARKRARHD